MSAAPDPSFDARALCGSLDWLALRLGRSKEWVNNNRAKLRAAGMPEKDEVLGLWIKADVDAWIDRRAVIKNRGKVSPEITPRKENLDAF